MRTKIKSCEVDRFQVRHACPVAGYDMTLYQCNGYIDCQVHWRQVSHFNDTSLCNNFPVLLCTFLQVHDSYVQKIDALLSTMAKAIKILEATPVGEILSKYLILLHLKVRIISKRTIFVLFFSS